jgi:thiamine-phosphate pyrophosphorylase
MIAGWKLKLLQSFRLYAVTDLQEETPDFLRRTEGALKGGVDIVQLRSKTLSDQVLCRIGLKLRILAAKYRKLFIVNDRIDLALACGADGIHLGQEDLSIAEARRILRGRRLILGKSTHSLAQARRAERDGADYIGVGPVFRTPTKPGYAPVGLKLVRQVSRSVRIPFVAIGGIDASNVARVLRAGAKRVAVVRAVFGARDTFAASKELKKVLVAS